MAGDVSSPVSQNEISETTMVAEPRGEKARGADPRAEFV
jgi:hypothetical protein